MQDALRNYVALATGLSKMSKKKAKVVAKQLAKSSGETVDNLQAFTEGLMTAGNANRDALVKLIRYEVDRALGTIGLATVEEVEQLTVRVHELERELREARLDTPSSTDTAPAKKVTSRRSTASKTAPTKTAPIKTAAASATAAKSTTAEATPRTAAKKTVAKKATTTAAKKTAAQTTVAKTTATKATATKATPTTRRRSATASSTRRTTPETSEE